MNDGQCKVIWKLPTPILERDELKLLPRRILELYCWVENLKAGGEIKHTLRFEDVWMYQCTLYRGCPPDLIRVAYQQLVDLGLTDRLRQFHEDTPESKNTKHFAIYMDDGPLYEVICSHVVVLEPNHSA